MILYFYIVHSIRVAVFAYCVLMPVSVFAQSADLSNDMRDNSFVSLAYSRVGEDSHAEQNIAFLDFKAQIDHLIAQDYNVRTVFEALDYLRVDRVEQDQPSILITFEGAYKSALDQAIPYLIEHDVPFLVFVSTDHADARTEQYMNWDDLRDLQKTGLADFGILSASYKRLSGQSRDSILTQINKAQSRFREEMGGQPSYFSYAFGEYSKTYRDIVEAQGFKAAFGLHSGAVYGGSDFFALPRFSMTEGYTSIDRFELIARSKPLKVYDVVPDDPYLKTDSPDIGFSLHTPDDRLEKDLSCFVSGQGKAEIQKIGETRFMIKLPESLDYGRTRVNCTLPLRQNGVVENWHWFGLLLVHDSAAEGL